MRLGGFKILPVLMVVAAISFGVRFNEFIIALTSASSAYAAPSEQQLATMAPAAGGAGAKTVDEAGAPQPSEDALQSPSAAPPIPDPKTQAAAQTGAGAKPDVAEPSMEGAKQEGDGEEKGKWKAAEDLDDAYADVKMEMFKDLSKRRKDLDSREKELAMREALLKAAQSELEQKTRELNSIKSDIELLLTKQTDEEGQRIASLVKIYEGMKAKDAARIFNTLDMDVLIQVMTKMSERKSAPIIAAMDPDKARNVTIMMAEQNKLPDLPSLPSSN